MSELTYYTRKDVLAFLEEEKKKSDQFRNQHFEFLNCSLDSLEKSYADMFVTLTNIGIKLDRQIRREKHIQLAVSAITGLAVRWVLIVLLP